MANFIYNKSKKAILNGNINFSSDNIKVMFTNNNYTASQGNHEFVSDIPASSIVFRSNSLVNKLVTDGIFDADNIEVEYAGAAFDAVILYKDTGSDSTSRLISYIDQAPGVPFPGSISQTDLSIVWNNGPEKILSL